MTTMTRVDQSTASRTDDQPVTLLLALELGERTWKLGCTTGIGQRPRVRQIPAGAVDRLLAEVTRAKARLGVPAAAPVVSCYEAGRDGFWLHRSLMAQGVTNHVVDSSSIEVPRRARRAKTDKLDLGSLLRLLARYLAGDRGAWRVVRVPSVAAEDARHGERSWATVQADRTRIINRLKGLLTTAGVRLRLDATFLERLATVRLWDGTRVPPGLPDAVTAELGAAGVFERAAPSVAGVAGGAGAGSDDGDGSGGGGVADGEGDRPDWDLGLGDGDLWLAADPERPRARGAGGVSPGPVPEWRDFPRPGDHPRGQQARAAGDGATGVELAAVSA